MSEPTWTAKMFDENKRLKATITELTAEKHNHRIIMDRDLDNIMKLEATITELTTERDTYKATCMADDILIAQRDATITELEQTQKNWGKTDNARLEATITELTKALDTIADYDTDEGDVARAALKEKTS